MSNLLELLDIDEAAAMLQCSVAKVRQMVIGDRTLAAVHEDHRGFRDTFELRGLRLFDVDDLGAITDVRTNRPAGFLRFDLAEVVRVLSERAHWEANAAPLSRLFHPALGESEPKAVNQPAHSAKQPKPSASASASNSNSNSNSNSTTPDPERRLARLRELGGNATYRHSDWKITGISALVASEESEGRKRSSQKTIRADLKEAAENEREAKRANVFSGL